MQATCGSVSVCGQCDIQCFVLFHSQTLTVPTNTEKTRSVNSSAQQYELMKWHWDLTEMLSFGQFGQAWNCMVNCIFQTIILRVCVVCSSYVSYLITASVWITSYEMREFSREGMEIWHGKLMGMGMNIAAMRTGIGTWEWERKTHSCTAHTSTSERVDRNASCRWLAYSSPESSCKKRNIHLIFLSLHGKYIRATALLT